MTLIICILSLSGPDSHSDIRCGFRHQYAAGPEKISQTRSPDLRFGRLVAITERERLAGKMSLGR